MLERRHVDRMLRRFEMLGAAIGTSGEKDVVERIYQGIPKRNPGFYSCFALM